MTIQEELKLSSDVKELKAQLDYWKEHFIKEICDIKNREVRREEGEEDELEWVDDKEFTALMTKWHAYKIGDVWLSCSWDSLKTLSNLLEKWGYVFKPVWRCCKKEPPTKSELCITRTKVSKALSSIKFFMDGWDSEASKYFHDNLDKYEWMKVPE